jgi:hypothetical protein
VGSVIAVVVMFFTFIWVKKWDKSWLDNSAITK